MKYDRLLRFPPHLLDQISVTRVAIPPVELAASRHGHCSDPAGTTGFCNLPFHAGACGVGALKYPPHIYSRQLLGGPRTSPPIPNPGGITTSTNQTGPEPTPRR